MSDAKTVAVAALKLHSRYGVDFTRRLAAAISRLVYLETGEKDGAPAAANPRHAQAHEALRAILGNELDAYTLTDVEGLKSKLAAKLGGGKSESAKPAEEPRAKAEARRGYSMGMDGDGETHRFSSTQLDLPPEVAQKILAIGEFILDEDLAEDGREPHPHVTIRYGLHTGNPAEVQWALNGIGPINLNLNAISCFEGSENGNPYDVLKIDVVSDGLRRTNELLGDLPHTDTHPGYHPHATIAYVKAGEGKRIAKSIPFSLWPHGGRGVSLKCTVAEVVFSDKKRNTTAIPLGGAELSTDAHGRQHAGKGPHGGEFVTKGAAPEQIDPEDARRELGDLEYDEDHPDDQAKAVEDHLASIDAGDPEGNPEALRELVRDYTTAALFPDLDSQIATMQEHGVPQSRIDKLTEALSDHRERVSRWELRVQSKLEKMVAEKQALAEAHAALGEEPDLPDDADDHEAEAAYEQWEKREKQYTPVIAQTEQRYADALDDFESAFLGGWHTVEMGLKRVNKAKTAAIQAGLGRLPREGATGTELSTDADDDAPAEALATLYATLWNPLQESGDKISSKEIASADAELHGTDWHVDYDPETEKWSAKHAKDLEGYTLAAERSPVGGVTIAGKHYPGGQFIPSKVMAEATPEERAKVEEGKIGHEEKRKAREDARTAKGSVDAEGLRKRLEGHAKDATLSATDKRSAGAAWRMLHKYHGDMAMHRLEELAGMAERALQGVDDEHPNADGLREQFGKSLAKIHHMMGAAETAGVTGRVEDSAVAEAKARIESRRPTPVPVPDEPAEETSSEPAADAGQPTARDAGPGPIPESVRGGNSGGSVGGDDGGAGSGSARPRIVTARPELTKQGNPELVPDALRQHLNEHQQQGVSLAVEAMDKYGGFVLADGTGVGKTRQELSVGQAFLDKGKKVVIVSPAEVIKPDWKKGTMSGSFAADSAAMGVSVKLTKGDQAITPGTVHVTTYNELGKLKANIDKDTVVIFDESHFLKNTTSARYKHGKDILDSAAAVMYATATPGDKPLHIAHLARAGVFGNVGKTQTYERLGMKLVDQQVRGGGTVKCWQIDKKVGFKEAARRLSGLFDQMTKDGLMIKRELSLDGVAVGMDRVELTPEQHDEIQAVYEAKMRETDNNKAVSLMAARMHQEPFKIPFMVEKIKADLAEGRSSVVFVGRVNDITIEAEGDEEGEDGDVKSVGTAKALKAALIAAGIPEADIGELHGGTTKTADQKKRAMADFQANKTKVIVATIQSGGTGINLDDTTGERPRSMRMMTPPFTANDMSQAVGRVVRLNTKSPSRVHGMLADTAIDDWNAGILENKFRTLGAIVGGESTRGRDAVRPEGAPDIEDAAEPFDWGETLKTVPKHYYNTPFAHNDLIGKFGGKRTKRGEEWTTTFPSKEAFEAYKAAVAPKPGAAPAPPSPDVHRPVAPAVPQSAPISVERKQAIHEALRQLHGSNDDRAREKNDVGFNQFDSQFGGQLAEQDYLSDRQAEAAAKMLGKYKRQLGDELHKKVTAAEVAPATVAHAVAPSPPPAPASLPAAPAHAPIAVRKVQTSRGERMVHSFTPSSSFWDARRAGKLPGSVSVRKNDRTGQWEASVWGESEDEIRKVLDGIKAKGVTLSTAMGADNNEDSETDDEPACPGGGHPLAELYAQLWNALQSAGRPIPQDDLAASEVELDGTGWHVGHDEETGRWKARHDSEMHDERTLSTEGYTLSAERAPSGYTKKNPFVIAGKHYYGGQFIPAAVVAEASPEERKRLEEAQAASKEASAKRSESLKASGPVNADDLQERLRDHKEKHGLPGDAKPAAAAWRALARHHGDAALHRVQEIMQQAEKGLEGLPDDEEHEGVRNRLGKTLARLHSVLDAAKANPEGERKGVTGEVKPAEATALPPGEAELQSRRESEKEADRRNRVLMRQVKENAAKRKTEEAEKANAAKDAARTAPQKQLWELTKREHAERGENPTHGDWFKDENGDRVKMAGSGGMFSGRVRVIGEDGEKRWADSSSLQPTTAEDHRDAVKAAVAAGKTVPAEVLKDYPDLTTAPAAPSPDTAASLNNMGFHPGSIALRDLTTAATAGNVDPLTVARLASSIVSDEVRGGGPNAADIGRAVHLLQSGTDRSGDPQIARVFKRAGVEMPGASAGSSGGKPTTDHAAAVMSAVSKLAGRHNLVSLANLHRETRLPLADFHTAVNELRKQGKLTGSAKDRDRTPAENAAAIKDANGGVIHHVSKREDETELSTVADEEGFTFAARHCPAGHTHDNPLVIGDHSYVGGEWIPADVVKNATPAEKKLLKGAPIIKKEARAPKEAKPAATKGEMASAKREGVGPDARVVLASGDVAPPHIKPSMVPPDWSDVKVSLDPTADVLVKARDKKNNVKTVYADSYHMKTAALKFARTKEFLEKASAIRAENQSNRNHPEKVIREAADCVWLMMEQATRPGSEADTKGIGPMLGHPMTADNVRVTPSAKDGGKPLVEIVVGEYKAPIRDEGTRAELLRRVESGEPLHDTDYWLKSFGATTLRSEHVVESPDGVRLQFVGKEGVWHDHLIGNSDLAAMLLQRKKAAGSGKIYAVSDGQVSDYASRLDGGKFTPKDFRTNRANELAVAEIAKQPEPPATEKEYKARVNAVAGVVSSVLGNRAAQALESYIDPVVFSMWRSAMDAKEEPKEEPKDG